MKLTEKMKKNLAILGGVLIGIGLIAAIGMRSEEHTSELQSLV